MSGRTQGGEASPVILAIAAFFENHTGQRLGESRLWRIETALQPVIREHGLRGLDDLLVALRRTPQGPLSASTLHCLMNHESSFFRDPNVFHAIEHQILPHLNRSLGDRLLRIWCAGCSTGQEVYSLAIILKRQEAMWRDWRISLIGTDVSPFAIGMAQAGLYPQMDAQRGLAVGDLLNWFEPADGSWQATHELRSMVSFKTDNLLAPRAVSGMFDLILCRNVLLYFSQDIRAQALAGIARFTRKDTVLLLGAGETTIGTSSLFVPSSSFRGAYERSVLQESPAPAAVPRLRAS